MSVIRRPRGTTTWNDINVGILITERRRRNVEYHDTVGHSRVVFWRSIANTINNTTGSNFSGRQCQNKFNRLVTAFNVSIDKNI